MEVRKAVEAGANLAIKKEQVYVGGEESRGSIYLYVICHPILRLTTLDREVPSYLS